MGEECTIDSIIEGLSEKYKNVNREYVEKMINNFIQCGMMIGKERLRKDTFDTMGSARIRGIT